MADSLTPAEVVELKALLKAVKAARSLGQITDIIRLRDLEIISTGRFVEEVDFAKVQALQGSSDETPKEEIINRLQGAVDESPREEKHFGWML